jgi:xanthosine utilization system XapX-like protein
VVHGADDDRAAKLALLIALGIGVLVGVLLAVISLLSPGTLPTLG